MTKKFIQLIIQQKGDEDYRSFLICLDEQGRKWELRGYGCSPEDSTGNVMRRFENDTNDWHVYGEMAKNVTCS